MTATRNIAAGIEAGPQAQLGENYVYSLDPAEPHYLGRLFAAEVTAGDWRDFIPLPGGPVTSLGATERLRELEGAAGNR